MELLFVEETHEYFLEGERLPSVSEILAPLKDFSMIPPDVLEAKRQFGTAIHKMVELYLDYDLDEDSLTADMRGCLDGFKAWERDEGIVADLRRQTSSIEKRQHHSKLKYAGTPDIDNPEEIIDIKSRLFDPISDPLQLSAYKNFGDPKRAGYILSLFPDGTFKFVKVPERQSWSIFRKMLKHYRDKQEFARLIENIKGAK
jgi:hypothetical protein